MAEDQQKPTDETTAESDVVVEDAPQQEETPQQEDILQDASTVAADETAEPQADATAGETVVDAEDAVAIATAPAPPQGMIGYTGEILGDVIKIEELDSGADADLHEMKAEDLRNLIESTLVDVTEHEIVSGRVVSVGEKDVVIDIGFKSDGIVPKSEFGEELSIGEEVEVFLERIEDYHGQLVLSKTKADTVRRWNRIESAYENEEVLEGTIVRRIKGGMIVELFDGMEAFLPGSQIDVRPVRDFDAYLEKRMEFKIVKLNPVNENIVVSHKALIEKDLQEQRESILSAMEPGQILEGLVKNITDFGVFIDLGGVDGLLHITDLSWGRVSHPSELVSLDEKLNVVVLDYDKERQRISLGLKQLQPHPWEKIEEKYGDVDTVEGKVVSITDYGAFIELEKGIEGLVHISEMSWTEHIRHPSQMVSLGQMVEVKILNIDTEGKKISLGMKQLEPDPWENIAERYPPGTVMRGTVRNITNFGVFVEIEPGIDGLVHISDLSWTKRVRHPGEMVKKGQDLDVVVLNIDTKDRRISLGHKQVDTNPWNQFAEVYAEGETTRATVVRVEDKGLVVELPLEVEAFIPTKELNQPTSLDETYPVGTTLEDLIVIRFSGGQKEIVLSQKAIERAKEQAERKAVADEERQTRRKEKKEIDDFRTKESTGPATLGELSGLADLKAQMEAAEEKVEEAEAESVAEAEAEAVPEVEAEAVAEAEVEDKEKEKKSKKAGKKEDDSAEEEAKEKKPKTKAKAKAKPKKKSTKKKEDADSAEDAEEES